MLPNYGVYWSSFYPYETLKLLAGGDAGMIETEIVRHFVGGGVERQIRYASVDNLRAKLALASIGDRTLSLHVTPDPRRFLVFDLDIRELVTPRLDPKDPEKKRMVVPMPWLATCLATHTSERVCPHCWTMARIVSLVLDVCVGQKLGLGPGLAVYSGGNGLHVWFHAKPGLHTREARQLIFAHLLAPAVLAQDAALVAAVRALLPVASRTLMPAAFLPTFDAGVTVDVPRTGHCGHAIKLPFSPHNKTRQLALPLEGVGAALAYPTFVSPDALVRSAGDGAPRTTFNAACARMLAWLRPGD